MSNSLLPSFLMSDVSGSLRSLTKNERCEWIAPVAHLKWVTMSDSLRSLTKNERPWADHSGRLPKMSKWANHSFFFAQKTLEQIPSPAISRQKWCQPPPLLARVWKVWRIFFWKVTYNCKITSLQHKVRKWFLKKLEGTLHHCHEQLSNSV